jgi:hemerythrin
MLIHMGEYAARHFTMEEKYMEAINYPGLAEQQEIHKDFATHFSGLYKDFQENGLTRELVETLRRELTGWIRDHVTGIDQQFGVYYKNRQ